MADRFWVFVEGSDDSRLLQALVTDIKNKCKCSVQIIEYRQKPKTKLRSLIRAIASRNDWDYVFLADIDDHPCITAKKEKLVSQYPYLVFNNILIVVREIEAWYLGGLSRAVATELGLPYFESTDEITKEKFNQIKTKSMGQTEFKLRMMESFDKTELLTRNTSFNYFYRKYAEL